MKLVDHLTIGDIELANGNRTRAYLQAGLLPLPSSSFNCGCDTIDEGYPETYTSPSADPAPWYDTLRPESAEFLGLLAYDVRLDSVARRSVTQKITHGATIGRLRLNHRIVSVRGLLLASTAQGQAYGEAWLRDTLTGVLTGCTPDSLRLLLSCPPESTTADIQWRTLRRIGIVDGPNFGPVNTLAECYIQEVQFQIAAGVPWLMRDEVTCLAEFTLTEGS